MPDTSSNFTLNSCLFLSHLISAYLHYLEDNPRQNIIFSYLNLSHIFFRSTLHLRSTQHQLKLHLFLSQGFEYRIKFNSKQLQWPFYFKYVWLLYYGTIDHQGGHRELINNHRQWLSEEAIWDEIKGSREGFYPFPCYLIFKSHILVAQWWGNPQNCIIFRSAI